MNHFLIVFLGGGIGAALRHGVNRLAFHLWPSFPAGTMIVNIVGSLVMGLLVGLFAATPSLSQHTRLFLATGVLGGFTTFSTFSLDALTLWGRGAYGPWLLYVGLSVTLSLLATAVGFLISRGFA
ncbi:MAG TPA: fluoride efflux transporter CrcB [Sphingomicrobium sp.]|nr:fluoride efflux transporter CrcB [Sphingomicrobium sp.]